MKTLKLTKKQMEIRDFQIKLDDDLFFKTDLQIINQKSDVHYFKPKITRMLREETKKV